LQSRDAPTVIKARVRAVGLTCLVCVVVTVYVLAIYGRARPADVSRLLGLWPVDPIDILKVLALVAVLFVGPLYESIIVDGDWREWTFSSFKEGIFDNWIGYRNLIVAPASEELVFRSLTISLYILAKVNPTRIVFTTPLIFGLAHVHHLVEFLQSRTPPGRRLPTMAVWVNGLIRSLFQFTYTSLFGFFAAFVYLRTGNLWAVIIAHSFCNWMGVPRLSGRVGQFSQFTPSHVTPDVAQGKRDDVPHSPVKVGNGLMQQEDESTGPAAVQYGPQNLGLGWTIVYYALIFGGAYGFYRLLFPLTESTNALVAF
jgi:prenyl protein peptidase